MPPLTIQQAFDLALQHHNSGHLLEAQRIYRNILAQQPDHPDSTHLLGVIAYQMGQHQFAVDLLRRAITLNPNWPEALCNLGNALSAQGQLDDAIAAYRQAIALSPNLPEAHNNLGNALRDKGQLDEAIAACRQAIALNPKLPQAHGNLGSALADKGQLEQAIAAHRLAIALNPNVPESHNNLGKALRENGQLDEAIASFRQAISLKPNLPEPHSNLGNALTDIGQLDAAIAAYRQAIALNPNLSEAHNNLGKALRENGQLDQAIAACRQAIALKPNYADAHNNLALSLLSRGDFQEGWQEYEWRWKSTGFRSSQRNFVQPQWDGGSLNTRSILIHAEQGHGDTLQFIRYIPLVAQHGGRIIIECQPDLHRLIRNAMPHHEVVPRGETLPAFDLHCPLLSLPRIFRTTQANIPNTVPYLEPDARESHAWQMRLAEHTSFLKVGLAWAGSTKHKNDRNRSIQLATLAPLGQIPGVHFISLQKAAAAQASTPPGMNLVDCTDDLKDFADTAALIANLDLVITVDTAVAHLAGAMAKPVWILLPFAPDWRWLLHRQDSPWYPTMRLFRQPTWGDWHSVIMQVAHALSSRIEIQG